MALWTNQKEKIEKVKGAKSLGELLELIRNTTTEREMSTCESCFEVTIGCQVCDLELELASTKKMLDEKDEMIKFLRERQDHVFFNDVQKQLNEAKEVIRMVQNNSKMPHQHSDYYLRLCCLSEIASNFLAKHGKKEGVNG